MRRFASSILLAVALASSVSASGLDETCSVHCPGPLSQGVLDAIKDQDKVAFETVIPGNIYRIKEGQEKWDKVTFADLVTEVDGCEVILIGDLTVGTGGDIIWSCTKVSSLASPCNVPVIALGIEDDIRAPGKLFVMFGETTHNLAGCDDWPGPALRKQ